ncbi:MULTISPECIES: phage baseplate assembly protein V [Flavobacterium]|uniref:phage baseplate assembly protein V n=1 Tax=Flavobacterium TaxID=237 RepID=UPI0011827EA6|nr:MULTISPECIES: phage baseplate assembly protein V [Flavobacterium]MCR4030197.1 contractile injection system protein, VgrG/Pvc8 family [Flavobacterium panacis]
MALQTVTTIKVGGIRISNFSGLEIIQTIHDHHSFSFQVRQDLLVEELRSVMPFSQQLYGEKISIEIKPIDGLEDLMAGADLNDYTMQFYGVVTEVELQKSRIKDMEETIVIKGHSSTIVLENGPECNSFIDMPLADIVNKVKEGFDIDMDVRPFYRDSLPYTVQYNESCFSFLNRLAKRNGQWFYYNGRTTVFGTPGGVGRQPKLVYGVNMQDFNYTMKLIPAMFKTIENDNREGEYRKDETLSYRKETDGFQQNFLNKGNKVFNKETVMQLNQNPVGGHLRTVSEEYTKNKMRAVLSRLMEVTASSDVPGITIGNKVTVSGVDLQLESSYRVTRIRHICDDGGGYENEFTAINFNNSVFSSETDPDLVPYCQSQTAVVKANADPGGLSAVQVQMPWQEAKGETTPYIPLMQQYGGDARGSHIIPEIGDTVFVDFQGNNAELPIVIGTMTSRKEKSDFFTKDNSIKGWKLRFGMLFKFIEKVGIWLSDPSGNEIQLDEEGKNINVTSPETVTIRAKNIVFEASESITIKAGIDIDMIADNNMTQEVGNDIFINAEGNIMERSDNRTELADKDFSRISDTSNEVASEASLYSNKENMTLQSGKQVRINTSENSNLF